MWQSTRADRVASSTDSNQGSAKPAATSASVKKTTLTFVTVSTPAADDVTQAPVAVAEAAPAAPAQAAPLPPNATITVPLAQAEHHMLGGSEVSILGVYHRPGSSDAVVDVMPWAVYHTDGTIAQGVIHSYGLNQFNSEDQAYIQSWAQQQVAAASNSTAPYVIAAAPPDPPFADSRTAFSVWEARLISTAWRSSRPPPRPIRQPLN